MNDQLVLKIRNCPNLPSLPAIAVQVLDLAQKADVDITEIARIISKDPALSSKMLRTVNSSFYARSKNVSTISQALVILGLQSVKTLVLGFSLVTTLAKNKSRAFKHVAYWKRSIYAATAARSLAAKIGLVQAEEAFLATLLMDIGMLVLDQVLEDEYGQTYAKAKSHAELYKLEMESLGMTHADVGGILAQQWKLPPLLTIPISFHHSADKVTDLPLRKMAEVVNIGGRCADVFVDTEPAPAISEVRRYLETSHKMSEADADALLDEIGKRTKETASLFEINIGSSTEFEAILKRANETLVAITLESQMHATQLQVKNEELQEKVTKDGLTGLSNRATFDEFIAKQLAAVVKQGQCLSLLMMDLDKFKAINDTHGHPAGDAVLKSVAKLLGSVTRPQDLAVRYGGEEMCLVLPDTPRSIAAAIAETIRRAIGARPVTCGNVNIPITASIGVATYEPGGPLKLPAHLIKAADLAVYNAKHGGRNCVKVFSVKPPVTIVQKPAA